MCEISIWRDLSPFSTNKVADSSELTKATLLIWERGKWNWHDLLKNSNSFVQDCRYACINQLCSDPPLGGLTASRKTSSCYTHNYVARPKAYGFYLPPKKINFGCYGPGNKSGHGMESRGPMFLYIFRISNRGSNRCFYYIYVKPIWFFPWPWKEEIHFYGYFLY